MSDSKNMLISTLTHFTLWLKSKKLFKPVR